MWGGSRRFLSPVGLCRGGCCLRGMEPGSQGAAWEWGTGAEEPGRGGDRAKSSSGRMVMLPLSLPQPRELCELTSVRAGACVPCGIPRAEQSGGG